MNDQPTIFVTGGTGFLGSTLLAHLVDSTNGQVRALVRDLNCTLPRGVIPILVTCSNPLVELLPLFDVDIIIHCAAYVGSPARGRENSDQFQKVNIEGTHCLVRQAANAGVTRFIFLSSIKVFGETTPLDDPLAPSHHFAPEDLYGRSKYLAEQDIIATCRENSMEYVIIRPPLIYGPGVKGNFAALANLVLRGIPLPFRSIKNLRSLVFIDNLVDLIKKCCDHPAAANRAFFVSDDEDLSTPELLIRIARANGTSIKIFPFPVWILRCAASLANKHSVGQKLFDSLRVDIRETKKIMNWKPLVPVDEALDRTFCPNKLP